MRSIDLVNDILVFAHKGKDVAVFFKSDGVRHFGWGVMKKGG